MWRGELLERIVEGTLARYDAFYREVTELLEDLRASHRRFVVLDLHSYCHRRGGAGTPPDDPQANPELNLGTESIDRDLRGSLVDHFREDLRAFDGSDRLSRLTLNIYEAAGQPFQRIGQPGEEQKAELGALQVTLLSKTPARKRA